MIRQLGLLIFALGASGTALAQNAPCTPAFDTDATVWDSAVMGDGTTLFPIGGSGQVNGAFTACATDGVQVALRASERFVGPITPDAGTGTYQAPAGNDGGDALWNVEFHVDMGYRIDNAFPASLADATVEITYDCDPVVGVQSGPTFTLPDGLLIPDTAILVQSSQNPSFAFLCGPTFDTDADGSYEISAQVLDGANVIAETQIQVLIGDNPPLPTIPPAPAVPIPSTNTVGALTLAMLLGLLGLVAVRRTL